MLRKQPGWDMSPDIAESEGLLLTAMHPTPPRPELQYCLQICLFKDRFASESSVYSCPWRPVWRLPVRCGQSILQGTALSGTEALHKEASDV